MRVTRNQFRANLVSADFSILDTIDALRYAYGQHIAFDDQGHSRSTPTQTIAPSLGFDPTTMRAPKRRQCRRSVLRMMSLMPYNWTLANFPVTYVIVVRWAQVRCVFLLFLFRS